MFKNVSNIFHARKQSFKKWAPFFLSLIHVKPIFHNSSLKNHANDCSSAFLITVWWMFLNKISHPLQIAADCLVCQLWKCSIPQLGHIAYCNQSQMQTFTSMIPQLWSLFALLQCSYWLWSVLRTKMPWVRDQIIHAGWVRSPSQKISLSCFLKDVQKKDEFPFKTHLGRSCCS